jgi:arylsulfatase
MKTLKQYTLCLLTIFVAALSGVAADLAISPRPNILIVMTDDQGYGDIGAHGHPFLKTPNMDKLHAESVRFTDFHVAPMCSPTRGQLMTGVDAMKNGCTAVCQGRSMVREEIPMLPKYFADAGYATGIFGKWHLGDSYPHRPQDRGFQEVLSFRAWGLPSLASHWSNNNPKPGGDSYTDPTLEHNGVDTPYPGYCGDIWYTEAMKYMADCQQKNKPFFVYLPNNLAHTPDFVPEKYSKPYAAMGTWKGPKGAEIKVPAKYYGMIANIDENMGRLEEFLVKNQLKENTIVLFLSDNGTRSYDAAAIHNGGMRGHKTEVYDGGHRVHCFFRWPHASIKHGRDVSELTEVQDIAPTLLELCGINPANRYPMDGVSWGGLLRNEAWPHANRKLTVQYRVLCTPWDSAVVGSEKWRLLKEKKDMVLFNVATDPAQKKSVAGQNPEVLNALTSYYDAWHKAAYTEFQKIRYIHLGNPLVPQVILYANDWQGDYCDSPGQLWDAKAKGAWDIDVETAGQYRVELSRWPFESGKALVEGGRKGRTEGPGARPIAKAQLLVADFNQTIETKPADTCATFTLTLKAGKTKLTANLLDKDGQILCGAMYVKATLLK